MGRNPVARQPLRDLAAVSSGRVLLVHGDEQLRQTLEILLTERYEVDAVGSTLEAVRAFSRHRTDVVLTSADLPVVDGTQMVKALRFVDPTLAAVLIAARAPADDEPDLRGYDGWWSPSSQELSGCLDAVRHAMGMVRRRRLVRRLVPLIERSGLDAYTDLCDGDRP